jgi:hypothetical protein
MMRAFARREHAMTLAEATKIYLKWLKRAEPRAIPQQPSSSASELVRGIWYLRNVNGLLARVGTKNRKVF